MSMLCCVLGVSPEQIRALRADPSLATEVAVGDGDVRKLGQLQEPLDLHKSWHMLHYLFTGSLDETRLPGAALLSGEELGEDLGYGPVRLHGEQATAEFARFLQGLDAEDLMARMDIGAMANAGVYAVSDDDEDLREDVAHFFPQLRDYVVQVAQKQGGLLTWLS
jgi:Domain of unknown function (DUF1877)